MAPPAPSTPAPTSKLPISRAALNALDKCRRPQPFKSTAELSTVLIAAALSEGCTTTTAPAKYVMRRLLTGVSVSSGAARLNYSLILTALTRQIVAEGGKKTSDECFKAVKDVYGPEGSFDTEYVGALRERALGTLASIAAVVAGCHGAKFSPSTVREMVGMLRSVVDADAAKWRLGCAAIRVLERVLALVSIRENYAVLKPMWAWCESRLEKEDGLQLALLLQEKGFISNKAFVTLYPSLDDGVLKALMDTFEGGFTSVAEDMFQIEDNKKEPCKYIVPLGWRLSVEYALTENGVRHWGGIAKFWPKAVFQSLLEGSRSAEKKLLALELINVVLDHIHDDEHFRGIFGNSLSSTVRLFLSRHANQKRRNGSVQLRATRAKERVMGQLNQSARRLGESILTHLCGESKKEEERSRLMSEALLWALRGGILFKLFPNDLLVRSLNIMSYKDIAYLFASTVSWYARPLHGADSRKFEKPQNVYQRPNAVRLLFIIAREHPYMMKDVIRVVVLYSLFEQHESHSVKKAKIPVSFDHLNLKECGDEDRLYLGLLPKPEPALNPGVLGAGFRQLVDFLTEQRNGEPFKGKSTFCISLIRKISAADSSICAPRVSTPGIPFPTVRKEPRDLQSVALELLDQLTVADSRGEVSPISGALKTITQFLYIHMFQPRDVTAESAEKRQELMSNYVSLMQKVESTHESLCQQEKHKTTGAEPDNGERAKEPIEPAEHIAHVIAEICGWDSSSFRQIAVIAVQELGRFIDDKVIAVLFDSMDSYLQEGEDIEEEEDYEDEMEAGGATGDKGADLVEEDDSDEGPDEGSDDGEVSEDGGENIEEKPSKSMVGGQEAIKLVEKPGSAEQEGSDDESESDVGMDIDEEDPSVLAKFDKVLGAHLSLLREEKKITKTRKERAAFRFIKVSRVLNVIETASRILRVALEKWDDYDPRSPLIFMDLHVRLYEFVLGGESKNLRFLKEVSSIVSKQLILPHSAFVGKISDVQTTLEIVDRFFELLRTQKGDHKGEMAVMRTISRSARSFLSVVEELSRNPYSRYFPVYKEALDNMLREDTPFWTPDAFRSFIHAAPEISLRFIQTIVSALKSEHITKTKRSLLMELTLMISTQCNNSTKICPEAANDFWKQVKNLVERECAGTDVTKKWTSSAFGDMVRVIANGLAGGYITEGYDVASALSNKLDKFAFRKQERNRFAAMLKSPKPVAVQNPQDINGMVSKKRCREEKVDDLSAKKRKSKY